MKDVKLVIFDLDGTLIDTMGSFADYSAMLMEQYYNIKHTKARLLYLKTSGFPFREQLDQIFPKNHLNLKVANLFEGWKKNFLKSNYKLRSGATDMIHKLSDKKLPVCVSSNSPQRLVDYVITKWKVKIDAALGYKNNQFKKGNPHFTWLENKFNLNRSEMIFIGDSTNDYRIASNSGVHFIALTMTFSEEIFKKIDSNILCFSKFVNLKKWILLQTD